MHNWPKSKYIDEIRVDLSPVDLEIDVVLGRHGPRSTDELDSIAATSFSSFGWRRNDSQPVDLELRSNLNLSSRMTRSRQSKNCKRN